ncbi:MAG: pyridoxamine 5'-phosphate oxidase family protein [Desulfotignum sp.]|nr:pyridoxamine 5'-phosphate oxidase family protein [Desulfotignum sp.]MCF8125826.1 pyridoxamine 5'-phosphate oxidase family protein [Desulfotignum sp.]
MPGNQPVKRLLDLVSQIRVMTLSTSGNSGPWAAPVYYLYKERVFYFFSSPDSRHIRDGKDRQCAASIFSAHDCIENLEGIQMSGHVLEPESGIQALAVAGAYARQFGISFSGSDPLGFFQNVFHARLYGFVPDLVYHMDNRRGFGFRESVAL